MDTGVSFVLLLLFRMMVHKLQQVYRSPGTLLNAGSGAPLETLSQWDYSGTKDSLPF